jgi:2-iminobutanoate/2-iminopropanoate deaminase
MADVEFLPVERVPPGVTIPFSEAVRVGPMLYLSGAIGLGPDGRLVAGGIEAETRQTMENIRQTLERHGSSMALVIKCTAMLADMAEWSAMNRVYMEYFPGHLPARSAFGTTGLALGARVEIEAIALADEG